MKKYKCIELKNYGEVASTIERYENEGWSLRSYQTAGMGAGPLAYNVYHYLLMEKES
jgi:hypothetical protein